MVKPHTRNNVAALTQRHSSPGQGLAPWDVTDTNVQRVALRPMAADCRRYSGGTIFRVIPFTPTGSTSNVAGGRLPPLRYICYKYRVFNVSIHVLRFGKCEKRGTLPPLHQNCHKYRIFYVPHAVFAPFHTLFHNPWTGCGIFSGGKPKSVNFA